MDRSSDQGDSRKHYLLQKKRTLVKLIDSIRTVQHSTLCTEALHTSWMTGTGSNGKRKAGMIIVYIKRLRLSAIECILSVPARIESVSATAINKQS